ncbi:hypothetical protein RB3983 [Rhodopirellula baltica SH 1]|uniref:Uncharacterized protein n=1 Tax=Rhodopirellula baltica (strain DSM 10527 / NCIMB 13988 / SH1) TaxID=243090 RepID=Q7UTB3_RHOBA|nr:hypothetical protein RB3983 [Rhodopirellula baltica SH 1]
MDSTTRTFRSKEQCSSTLCLWRFRTESTFEIQDKLLVNERPASPGGDSKVVYFKSGRKRRSACTPWLSARLGSDVDDR